MNFNLIPWDTEAYLIAADYEEEQGKLLTNTIRCKILPLDIENGGGGGCDYFNRDNSTYGICHLNNYLSFFTGDGDGHGYGICYGCGSGPGDCGYDNNAIRIFS